MTCQSPHGRYVRSSENIQSVHYPLVIPSWGCGVRNKEKMEWSVVPFAHDFGALGWRRVLQRRWPGLPQRTLLRLSMIRGTVWNVLVPILQGTLNGREFSLRMCFRAWLSC